MSAPRKIHIATAAYLDRFAADGRLMAHRLANGGSAPCSPRSVGYRKDFWGKDSAVATAVEEALSKYETPATDLLTKVIMTPDLRGPDRALLASFIAIHTLRTPAFRQHADRLMHETVEGRRAVWNQQPEAFERAAERWKADPFRWPSTVQRQITRVASSIASMQWTVLRFQEPVIITSDQPVVMVPILQLGERRQQAVWLRSGFMNIIELRFPLDPRHVLLGTWADQDDAAYDVMSLEPACDINRTVRGQADAEWFSFPDRPAPFVTPPFVGSDCAAIAPSCLAGYGDTTARTTERRRRTDQLMNKLVDDGDTTTVRWVYAGTPAVD